MTAPNGFKIAGLFPEPKQITLTGGETELNSDVRLVTSNVKPMQRKAMRGILTGAGIRVVANKKKYVIEAKVLSPEELNIEGIPEDVLDEYYELEVQDSLVFIRACGQNGILWGTQTFAILFRAVTRGEAIPNLCIRDWPIMSDRGIFVENKWGPDRMDCLDWCLVIDRIAAMKMNRLGIGLYGCWGNCRFEGQPSEFLMIPPIPIPDEEWEGVNPLHSTHKLRWFSPYDDEWKEEEYLPAMYRQNFLADVVRYGEEKGVSVIPFVNSFGHNTLLPRLKPELSAKDADGNPTGVGYSIADPAVREFIQEFYTSLITRHYPNGIDYFHIQMDEVWPDYPDPDDPKKVGSPWCEAPISKEKTNEENLKDYILWLVKMLTDQGVEKVVMWNDQLTRHMDVLDDAFLKQLEDAGLKDRLVIHWWCYSNETINDKTHVEIGKKLGLEGWVAPMTCYYNWQRYDYRRPNIELMMKMGLEEGAAGAVSYSVHDPAFSDHEALLAAYAWTGSEAPQQEITDQWSERFLEHTEQYQAGVAALLEAHVPALGLCYHYTYTYCNKDIDFPRAYPGEALEKLGEISDAVEQLDKAAAKADEARSIFAEMVDFEAITESDRRCARSLMGHTARVEAIATVFSALLAGKDTADARVKLLNSMAIMEKNLPDWVAPASLMSMSVLLEALD